MKSPERIKVLDVEQLHIDGERVTATAAELNAAGGVSGGVAGVAAGYKVARGAAAITGSGTVASGLTTIVSAVACLKDDASISGDTVTATWTGATLTLKVWKPTSTTDCTPIAASASKNVSWIAIGT